MIKYIVSILVLFIVHISKAQRQNTENVQLRVSTISFQDMLNSENNSLNYHKAVNQAFKEIIDGNTIDGLSALKTSLYGSATTLPIDWFVAGIAYARLNEKQGVELMLNEATSRDSALYSLMKTPLYQSLIGSLFGEKAWREFINQSRVLKNSRPDLNIINTIKELERLEIVVESIEKQYKDSILVHFKNDKKIIDKYQTQIQAAKVNRDKEYVKIIDSDAWPFNRLRKSGQTTFVIEYDDGADWYQKNEAQLINMLYSGNLLPWEFAFIHDWHAKRHRLPQKYALFYGQRLDEKTVMNCEAIGMPWGEVRNLRLFYTLPENF